MRQTPVRSANLVGVGDVDQLVTRGGGQVDGVDADDIEISGLVQPSRPGQDVHLRLLKKSNGSFHLLAAHIATLTNTSYFHTAFARPTRGTCRIEATYPGDNHHLATKSVHTFRC